MPKSIYPSSDKKCLNCQSEIPKQNKFCDRSCAALYNNKRRSKESRKKQALTLAKTVQEKIKNNTFIFPPTIEAKPLDIRICIGCKNEFEVHSSRKNKHCSLECSPWGKIPGGYREGSGRSKTGYFQGYYCGSTYELAWIIYQLDHHIPFQRFPGYLSDGDLKYYPDFLLPNNTIIEIKGYHTEAVDKKCKLAENKGFKIEVLYKEDLKDIFDYVSMKYQIPQTKFYILYE